MTWINFPGWTFSVDNRQAEHYSTVNWTWAKYNRSPSYSRVGKELKGLNPCERKKKKKRPGLCRQWIHSQVSSILAQEMWHFMRCLHKIKPSPALQHMIIHSKSSTVQSRSKMKMTRTMVLNKTTQNYVHYTVVHTVQCMCANVCSLSKTQNRARLRICFLSFYIFIKQKF